MNQLLRLLLPCALLQSVAIAGNQNPDTDWFSQAGYGLFMHCLPSNKQQLEQLNDFDVDRLAREIHESGAQYFIITLGQNSGYFISPNTTYDEQTGYSAGARCSTRDLPLHLYAALQPRGIRLLLYLPCQAPNRDPAAQRAFGLPEGPADQPLTLDFARRWAAVIQEWSDRYGDKVSGWWFDGAYDHVRFDESVAQLYAKAARHGNPHAIVTFNPGVRVIRHTQTEDYTAGELNEPLDQLPTSRWLEGSQWHALTYLGSNWGQPDTRYTPNQWATWINAVMQTQGVVSLDIALEWAPADRPLGSLQPDQMQQLLGIRKLLTTR
ncbi:MAG: alpha-L-fucosidase [Limisphaerales bacterium]